jgi:type I restriction enzyme, S subunit
MIPEGWQVGKIKDLVKSLDAGVSVNSEDRSIQNGEIGILKVSAVSYGQFLPSEHKVALTEEHHRLTIYPKKNCILISRANTPYLVGASVYIDRDYPNLFLPDKLWQTEPKHNNFSLKWLSYLIASDDYRVKISSHATGTSMSMKNISKVDFLNIEIVIPPLPEQCKIAEILGAWDDAIALLEKLIAAKRKLKQGLMQQLLTGKKRFKEFEGSEWETVRLKDITTINYGKSPKNIFSRDGQFPVYGTGGITGYTSTHIYDGESVIIGRKGTIDKVRYVSGKFWAIDTTYYLEFRQIVKAKWIYYFLSFTKLELLNEASGVPSLNRDTLYSIKINLPSLPEQEKIAAVLSATDTEISNLEKQLAAYKQQKRGLMQQLLTGKTRVRVN